MATSEIYLLDSEVRVCDESKTRDVATVEFREWIVFLLIYNGERV